MVNVAMSKSKILAIAVGACLAATLIAVPAYAFYYVHGDVAASGSGKGVAEVCVTVDATASGEGVWTELVFVPEGGTVGDAIDEMIKSSESNVAPGDIKDHTYTSMKDYVAAGTYDVKVYAADSQKPGTQVTQDGEGTSADESTVLQRYDNVVFTAK